MSHITKIVHEREHKVHVEFNREFRRHEDSETCFSFPCNMDGTLKEDDPYFECWHQNYLHCVEHPEIFADEGIVKCSWGYVDPAEVVCSCGEHIFLDGDTQCPNCFQWYNGFGQGLKDPEYWETDEDPYDAPVGWY